MKKIKLTISIILILVISIQSITFANAQEKWDDFWTRFMQNIDSKPSDLSDEDINRMIAGPTEEERLEEFATHITSEDLSPYQDSAKAEKESRRLLSQRDTSAEGVDSSVKGRDSDKAKELKDKIMDKKSSKGYDPSKMTVEELKEWENIITDYAIAVGGATNLPEDITEMYAQLNSALIAAGETGRNIT